MTMVFRPDELTLSNIELGRKVKLRVIAHAHDDKVQAVNVLGVLSANANPHITISYDMDKGGTAKGSNDMLKKALSEDKLALANINIDLDGIIDTYPRSTTKAQETSNG